MLPIPLIFESFANESLKKILPAISFLVSNFQNENSGKIKDIILFPKRTTGKRKTLSNKLRFHYDIVKTSKSNTVSFISCEKHSMIRN